ncbi:MAG: heme A synthase [Acidobacteria bacterium]|nr:heme A synthase [Acidobacteriota bacterium]
MNRIAGVLLHLFAALVAASTALLIFAGGLVTSTGSGLSVPDWPNTYGWFMLTFPLDKMVGGIFYEHSHRLIATFVGLLIVVLAIWLWRAEPRRWVRRLGYIALAAVITQGILGGITVLWFLPDAISIAHAGLAQLVFCLTVSIALFTSPGWRRAYAREQLPLPGDRTLQTIAALTTASVYAQIMAGATMRHMDAGLAIPDFPLAFGRLVPPFWNAQIALNYAHRVGALLVSALVLAVAGHGLYHHRGRAELRRPSLLLLVLLAVQITLGALTVLSGKHYVINSLHVVTGAMVLGTSLVLTLRAYRPRFRWVGSDPIHGSTQGFDAPRDWGLRHPAAQACAAGTPRRGARA